MKIKFEHLKADTTSVTLDIDNWVIEKQQSWGVFSIEGDIGSLLGDLLCDEVCASSGRILKNSGHIAQVSLAEQQRLLEQEIANDDSDFLDRIDTGSTVYALVYQQCEDEDLTLQLMQELDLNHLQDSGFRVLSSGETRRLMLARALATQPDFLVLDEPFAGLDLAHRKSLGQYLTKLSQSMQMLVIVSREEEVPEWIEKIALFGQGRLDSLMDKSAWDVHPVIAQIRSQSEKQSEQMLELIRRHRHSSPFDNPIFALKNGKVAYTDKIIFSDVNWRINKGEHWQVKGPNGCGKSTLLGLLFGDHPQCYSNDIQIFGKQRGSGETIWEIKKHIGMVSSALHLQYRVDCSALQVILSGFYDSIGLYQKATRREQEIAKEWLAILHMTPFTHTSFRKLEYGQQRLLLVARAIVKQPTLLILDEPYQGLDYLGRRLIKNALELIARENLSQLLYVSHYQEDSLDSIHNYLEFTPDKNGQGYKTVIS
ncbi:molybdate ABC transporter ATP-binding protein ModF [uncultured Desulfuromusa sp.]|uniref:molybdate ABC transporter ATP-binding protein ModF n=1 Tax=uncultured Desulfuromusa sp. TaxID=219183 RepID=UPI002AA93EE9|nr:molybdate ABC transporter ATP-binding protein ModF [uncultured Desulfuromusa sp.]